MKKRIKRYSSGGLPPEMEAAGWSLGQNPNIREEDRQAALAQFRAQMSSEDSPYVRDVPQMQGAGLSDAQAAQLMGRQVNAPARAARPVASPATFESNYPPQSRFHNTGFEEGYPPPASVQVPPRRVQLPPQEFLGDENYGTTPSSYLNTRVNPYVQDAASDFLTRQDRAYQTAPRSAEMVNNPARERLMRAIGQGSENVYEKRRVDKMNARQNQRILESNMQSQQDEELQDYLANRNTGSKLLDRYKYFFNRMGASPDGAVPPKQNADPERVQRLIDNLKKQHKARNYKKGGAVKKAKTATSKASSRGDGIAQRGKTKGRMV